METKLRNVEKINTILLWWFFVLFLPKWLSPISTNYYQLFYKTKRFFMKIDDNIKMIKYKESDFKGNSSILSI